MARKPTGNPVGAPEKPIDWTLFEQLCALHCTQTEIASMLKVHYETLQIRVRKNYGDEYPNVYKKFCEQGKCSLRRFQFSLAKKNTAMAIWLGKQWLGQKDNQELDVPQEAVKQFQDIMSQISRQQKESINATGI